MTHNEHLAGRERWQTPPGTRYPVTSRHRPVRDHANHTVDAAAQAGSGTDAPGVYANLRRLVRHRPNAGLRLVLPDAEQPAHRLGLMAGASAGNKSARDRRVSQVDGD